MKSALFGMMVIVCAIGAMFAGVKLDQVYSRVILNLEQRQVYDPNAREYKYLPVPPEGWTKAFGATERARMLYAIAEVRVGLEVQKQAVAAIQQQLAGGVPDVNEVTK